MTTTGCWHQAWKKKKEKKKSTAPLELQLLKPGWRITGTAPPGSGPWLKALFQGPEDPSSLHRSLSLHWGWGQGREVPASATDCFVLFLVPSEPKRPGKFGRTSGPIEHPAQASQAHKPWVIQ